MRWMMGVLLLVLAFCFCCCSGLQITAIYPGATGLTLRGDHCGLSWSDDLQMTQTNDNTFTATVECNSSSVGETLWFKTLMQGVWQVGANVGVVIGENACATTYPWFGTQLGNYQIVANLYSSYFNNSRDVIVYFPPSYVENTLKVYENVLVMHDGQNLFNDSTSFLGIAWNIQETIDPMVIEGLMDEVVVVGLYNTPDRTNEYTYSYDPSEGAGGQGKQYIEWIEQIVLPWVKSNLRVKPRDGKYGILGSSLGGLISCYAGWTRSSVWGLTGCMSSSFWWNSMDFNNSILVNYPPPPHTDKFFYIDTGTDEGSTPALQVNQTLVVAQSISNLGFAKQVSTYLQQGGQHNEYYWGKRFHVPMSALYGTSAQSGKCE